MAGYLGALRAAIAVPVGALLIGAVLCLAMKKTGKPGMDSDTELFRIDSTGAGPARRGA